jgi:hypothetical protein
MQAMRRGTAGAVLSGLVALSASLAPAAHAQTPIRVGQTVNGTLAAKDPKANGRGPFRVYQLSARQGQRLSIRMNSSDFDTYLTVGRTVAGITDAMKSDDDGGGEASGSATNSRVRWTVPATGQYLLIAQAYSDSASGAYTLSVDTLPRAIVRPPQPIAMGQVVAGSLEETDPSTDDDIYYDLYTFPGREGERLVLRMDAEPFDTYLEVGRIQNGEFESLASNDDAPGGGDDAGTNSLLRWTVPGNGQYVVRARSLGTGATGAYTLKVETRPAPPPPPAPRRIALGETASGSLDDNDPVAEDESFYDAYVFRGRAGDRVSIIMRSEAFDTYVVLGRMVDGQFQQIDTADDGAEGTNSKLDATLDEDGEYVVRANSLNAGATGAYTLVVQAANEVRKE